MPEKSELMGFVRKTKSGNALKVNISVEAFNKAERYTTQDGTEFVPMVISLERLYQLIQGERELTNFSQLADEAI